MKTLKPIVCACCGEEMLLAIDDPRRSDNYIRQCAECENSRQAQIEREKEWRAYS